MRTPAEHAIYLAERPIYDAAARLEKCLATLATLHGQVTGRLPIEAAENHLDGIEDDFDGIRVKLTDALAVLTVEIDRLQEAEIVRHALAESV